MTLKELIDSGLIEEDEMVTINRSVRGPLKNVMANSDIQSNPGGLLETEIFGLNHVDGRGWHINLYRSETEK